MQGRRGLFFSFFCTAGRACGSMGVACGEAVLASGACTWNTVWWKSVYALERAPVPSSCSRRKLPRKVTCSTRCAKPCWSPRSSTLPARAQRPVRPDVAVLCSITSAILHPKPCRTEVRPPKAASPQVQHDLRAQWRWLSSLQCNFLIVLLVM